MSLTVAACATTEPLLPPGSAEGKPIVRISTTCENLAKEVPMPSLKVGDDAKAQLFVHRNTIGSANRNLRATKGCQVKQRKGFAGKK